eukprot:jgi/Ulvmu1/169/UM001_0173.1
MMNQAFQDVSLEDIQQQLQLLGHSVPDHLVSAYLREVNASNHAPESCASPSNEQGIPSEARQRTHLKLAPVDRPAACKSSANTAVSQSNLLHDDVSLGGTPRGDADWQSRPSGHAKTCASPHQDQAAIDRSGAAGISVAAEERGGTGFVRALSPSLRADAAQHQSVPPQKASDSSAPAAQEQSSDPDHLLPTDVLQRARSIINEHLAEHRMPLVESLSDFTLDEAPSSQPYGTARAPKSQKPRPWHGHTSTRSRLDDLSYEQPFTHDAHQIPHTARIPTSTRQKAPHPATHRPKTAPHKPYGPKPPVAHHENDSQETAQLDAHMVRLRKGASSRRRNVLESLGDNFFNSELRLDDSATHSSAKAHGRPRPQTAAPQPRSSQRHPQSVRVSASTYMRRYSSHGPEEDGEVELQHQHAQRTPRMSSPQPPRLRPQVNLNSSFLSGRSCLSGQARKIDRVARYQQLNKQWSKDSFLSTTSRRRNQGFREAYAAAHELSQAELTATKAVNSSGRPSTGGRRAYVPPGENRRDRLRWDVRTRMQMQDEL